MADPLRDLIVDLSRADAERVLAFRRSKEMQELIQAMFRKLGRTTTIEDAQAIVDEAGTHGAALIELATLGKYRVHALRCKQQESQG